MNREFSIYLDGIRIAAAFAVYFTHLPGHMGGILWQLAGLGHEAVILFFVMSGYVIAYVTDKKETTATEYAANRFSRIYSVAIPAIILTTVLYYLGNAIDSTPFIQRGISEKITDPATTILAALFFVNEAWWEVIIFSDLPYWSLGYEVLYYVFFGILIFSNGKKRFLLLVGLAILMGPRVVLYLPIWFIGVFSYKICSKFSMPALSSYLLYAFSLVIAITLCLAGSQTTIDVYTNEILGETVASLLHEQSVHFFTDYLLALAVSANIIAFYSISNNNSLSFINITIEKIIRFTASYTFSLYLFHAPILFFIESVAPYKTNPITNIICCTFGTLMAIVIIGNFTEKKKHLYKDAFYWVKGAIFISNKQQASIK